MSKFSCSRLLLLRSAAWYARDKPWPSHGLASRLAHGECCQMGLTIICDLCCSANVRVVAVAAAGETIVTLPLGGVGMALQETYGLQVSARHSHASIIITRLWTGPVPAPSRVHGHGYDKLEAGLLLYVPSTFVVSQPHLSNESIGCVLRGYARRLILRNRYLPQSRTA